METIIQLFANNEIRIKVQTEAANPWRPVDKSADKAREHRSILLDERADIRRTVLHHFSQPIGYRVDERILATQLNLFSPGHPVAFEAVRSPVFPVECVLAEGDEKSGFRVRVYNHDTLLARERTLLDITKKSQRVSSHANWGRAQTPKAFGLRARHRILESGAVIDREKPMSSTYELTLTLPGSTPESVKALANWSGWVVNRQLQSVRRLDKNKDVWWFFVWEFQKRGALHQHWCVAASTPELAYEAAMKIKEHWYKCLHELSEKLGIDMFSRKGFGTWKNSPKKWQWHCQRIKKSVAAYFSKYTSKESKNVRRESVYTRKGIIHYPSRWWGSSSQVKLAVKHWRLEGKVSFLSREVAESLRAKLLELCPNLELTKVYDYAFDVGSEVPTCKDGTKTKRLSYCNGTVWILYVSPSRFADVHSWFRDTLGSPAERSAGNTLMQKVAQWFADEWGELAYTGAVPEYATAVGRE